jgi:hypothetical protein
MRTPCPGCGSMMNRACGWTICHRCRYHENVRVLRSITVAVPNRKSCTKCGRVLSRSARGGDGPQAGVCLECRGRHAKHRYASMECTNGCGKRILTGPTSAAEPKCRDCRRKNVHGIAGWKSGCECHICSSAWEKSQEMATAWEAENHDRRLSNVRRNKERMQRLTAERATRSGPFSPAEDAVVLRKDISTTHCAIILGRTYNSVDCRRKRLRSPGGFPASRRRSKCVVA